jgi:hypothetical protein
MKIYSRVFLVLAIASILCGCYESIVPMASSKHSYIEPDLIGKWKKIVTADDATPADMLVLNFNDKEYYVKYQDEKDVTRYRAYIVTVKGVPFINAQFIERDERPFVFFRYSLSKEGVLTLRIINGDFVKTKFRSSREFYKFIKKHLQLDELYGEPVRFKRGS